MYGVFVFVCSFVIVPASVMTDTAQIEFELNWIDQHEIEWQQAANRST